MIKRLNRFAGIALSISLLLSTPAYAQITVVPPAPTGGTENTQTPSTGGTVTEDGPGSLSSGADQGPGQSTSEPGSTSKTPDGPAAGIPQNTGSTVVNTTTEPQIQAQGAVLMDASTGKLLYSKNAETKYYPASITKLMTALLVAERSNLDDTVTFSKSATTNLEAGAVTLGLVEGDTLSVRQSLYGLLLKSANEVANGLAEHVSGSVSSFADLMNARAKELGCTNTHFVNPNGLNNSNHYTTPHDMALIGRAAFQNQTVRKAASTLSYQIPATKKAGARTISLGHKMLYPNDSRYYEGVLGGKTGYTSLAGNTLVTCAERNGVRLVAVIMKSKSTQYTDTRALLDYGFALEGGNASVSRWVQDGSRWYFVKPNGSKAANEWMTIDGSDYWFDSDSCMATGWRKFADGNWFYLGTDGAMRKNTTTPDGYKVDASGIWIK